jgi:hypothetical protein
MRKNTLALALFPLVFLALVGCGGGSAPACSDVDCGGSCVKKCAVGKSCRDGTDCASSLCLNHLCASAACANGLTDGRESDIDCGGGECRRCSETQACYTNVDCEDGTCNARVCRKTAMTCVDQVKGAGETDVDCGGPTCGACAAGKSCLVPADCESMMCNSTTLKCDPLI